jgi:aspartate kinase
VLNSRNPQHPGTRVQAEDDGPAQLKAITVKTGLILLEATVLRSLCRSGLAHEVFAVLQQHGSTPEVASVSDTTVLVTLDRKELVPLICNALGLQVKVHAENSRALVSLVAENIHTIPELVSLAFAALEGLQVRPIAHGASNLSLSFVVAENDAAEAVRHLHEQLLQCRAELAFVAD